MAFDEVRLPEEVEKGAEGGPRFKTSILPLSSGHEKRNVDWVEARGDWDIGYGIQSIENLELVRDFFYARAGRARGFRFKDWSDYTGTAQNIGTGDNATVAFQLRKQYTSGLVTYNRLIYKPVAGTVRIFLNGVETFGFTVDTTTGIVTMGVAPGAAVAITATYEFDVPVRFDTDHFRLSLEIFNAGSVPSLPVIELRQ